MSKLIFLISLIVLLLAMNSFVIVAVGSYNGIVKESEKNSIILSSARVLSVDGNGDFDDEDVPITGSALERASASALSYIGEGRVTDTEIGDEEGYYEIEITLNDGSQVDVHLDEDFNVLSTEYEDGEDD